MLSLEIPSEVQGYLWMFIYLAGVGLALSFLYSISEWFSKDRVLRVFERRKVLVLLDKSAIYGKLHIPPRAKGGFEIFFDRDRIENPLTLIAFLMENYRETGDEKFLREARELWEFLKSRGVIPGGVNLEDVRRNPWSPPSLVSRKVYPSDLGKLHAIVQFRFMMSVKEIKRRVKELHSLYHPSFIARLSRKLYNSLAYVKDKLSSSLATVTTPLLVPLTPELRKAIEEARAKAVSAVGALYEPLLENGIGQLVTVRVKDVDGKERYYQGILREYSANYIAVYDVDYRVPLTCVYVGGKPKPGYPKPFLEALGWRLPEEKHLDVEVSGSTLKLKNIDRRDVKVIKVSIAGKELSVNKVLCPGEELKLGLGAEVSGEPEVVVEYEVSRQADVVWPRSKAVVVGLGDYPPRLLSLVLP